MARPVAVVMPGDGTVPSTTQALAAVLPGISGILVTPFDDDGRLAPRRLRPIVDRAIRAGVHILTANGNTGEFYGLTTAEAEQAVHDAAEAIEGRVPVIAGVGRSIGDAVALARSSRAAGASGLMVHQPPDPFVSPRGTVAYLERIVEAGDGLPVVLYLRNDAIGLDAIERLCAVPGVVGVKWASPTPLRLAEAIRRCDPAIVWVGGLAEPWAPPLCAVGARGFTSGLINVWPERSVAVHAALVAGDYPLAGELIAGMRVFEDLRAQEGNGTNVTVVKAALALLGEDCGAVRPPGAWPLTGPQARALRETMAGWGLVVPEGGPDRRDGEGGLVRSASAEPSWGACDVERPGGSPIGGGTAPTRVASARPEPVPAFAEVPRGAASEAGSLRERTLPSGTDVHAPASEPPAPQEDDANPPGLRRRGDGTSGRH